MMTDHARTGLSRRIFLSATAGAALGVTAAAAGAIDPAALGLGGGAAGAGAPAAEAATTQPEPRHGAGEWTTDPQQDGLSQSAQTQVAGDIAAMPLDVAL